MPLRKEGSSHLGLDLNQEDVQGYYHGQQKTPVHEKYGELESFCRFFNVFFRILMLKAGHS